MAFDMQNDDENMDLAPDDVEGEAPPEESNNRFWIVVAVMGGIMLLAFICLALIFFTNSRNKANIAAEANARATQNAAMILSSTQTAEAFAQITPTFTPAPPTSTPTSRPSNTPVLAPTITPTTLSGGPNEATVAALNTLVAERQKTAVTLTMQPTAIPNGGFADDVGAPGLLGLAVVLVVIIFLARRLRVNS